MQYYSKIDYTDRQTIFLHSSNSKSLATDDEGSAQAYPFAFAVRFSLAVARPFLSFGSGPYQACICQDSGPIALASPDFVGRSYVNVVAVAPPVVESADHAFNIGRVFSSKPPTNGLEVVQQLGIRQLHT